MSIRSFFVIGSLLLGLSAGVASAASNSVFDADADGVPDDRDSCPYTPVGIGVHADGCSTRGDEDEDGIPDVVDACPLSPGGAVVDSQGCALDEDIDGVADGVDRCPMSPLGALVNASGCAAGQRPRPDVARRAPVLPPAQAAPPLPPPVVARPAPAAPFTPPPAVRAALPYTPPPPPAVPSAVSRPTASPPAPVYPRPAAAATQPQLPAPHLPPIVGSAPGTGATPSAASPSPSQQLAVRTEPERTYYFDEGDSDLSWSAERAIKQTAHDLMPELEKNPGANLVLSGHSDTKSDGLNAARLATARAQAVRNELIRAGVPAARISLRVPGVGEPRFVGASLARNCRVELRVSGRQGPTAPPIVAIAAPSSVAAPVAAPAVVVAAPAPVIPPSPVAAVPAVTPAPPPKRVVTAPAEHSLANASVNFLPYSAMLDGEAMKVVDAFVQTSTRPMLADVAARVVITGGIEGAETGAAALRLAESRAASVSLYLVSLGLPRNRVEVSSQAQTGARRTDLSLVSR